MNTLRIYLNSKSRDEQIAFAKRCGTSIGHLRNILCGFRVCSESLAIAIEIESGGAVTVEELRPDLMENWNYIRGTAKRPAPDSPEAAA